MDCETCGKQAVIAGPGRCKQHFIEGFEQRVWDTIERFSLIQNNERICVAASGGKDSLALLEILNQRYDVEALCVDEGIPGYREQTISDLQAFCTDRKIPLRIVSFADLGSKPLSELDPSHPCSVCGVLRRKALLKYSTEYDLLATGHNLDDECQNVMMNVLRNQQQLMARLGPRTAPRDGIAARIKPFYTTPEREVRAYCLLKDITSNFSECPNIVKSFRWTVGEALNELERERPGSKQRIIEEFLAREWEAEESGGTCSACNGPASGRLCQACKLIRITS